MQKTESILKNEWVLPTVAFLGVCSLFLGKLWIPLAFLLWVGFGWKVSLLFARHFVVGTKNVKNAVGIALYLAGMALISGLAVVF